MNDRVVAGDGTPFFVTYNSQDKMLHLSKDAFSARLCGLTGQNYSPESLECHWIKRCAACFERMEKMK